MSVLVPVKRSATFPWAGFSDLEQQFDRLFGPAMTASRTGNWMPPVDIHETDDAYVLEADLPGMTKDDISLTVLEDRITLTGTRKREKKHEERGYSRYERSEGSFERSFRIQGGIDADKVEAQFVNGVLTVKLPKPEEQKPRQIEVNVS